MAFPIIMGTTEQEYILNAKTLMSLGKTVASEILPIIITPEIIPTITDSEIPAEIHRETAVTEINLRKSRRNRHRETAMEAALETATLQETERKHHRTATRITKTIKMADSEDRIIHQIIINGQICCSFFHIK